MRKTLCMLCVVMFICGCGSIDNEVDVDAYKSPILEDDSSALHHYETLESSNQGIYECFYDAIVNLETKVIISSKFEDQIINVVECITNDHPELFYLENYTIGITNDGKKAVIEFSYNKTKEEIEGLNDQLELEIGKFKNTIPTNSSDVAIASAAYYFIIDRLTYDLESEDNQTILSSLIMDTTVCAGYARGYQYLLESMGMEVSYILVDDYEKEEGALTHAINMVNIDDDYFYVDTTWADVSEENAHACNAYFLMTHESMISLYKPLSEYKETKVGLIGYNSYETDVIKEDVQTQLLAGSDIIELKFDVEIYDYAFNALITNEGIFRMLKEMNIDIDKINYTEITEIGFIEIIF